MDAPRALVFQPLVEVNEALGCRTMFFVVANFDRADFRKHSLRPFPWQRSVRRNRNLLEGSDRPQDYLAI